MDIYNHFESYRKSVIRDALDGFAEFSKTIPSNKSDLSVYDYLRLCVNNIQASIAHSRVSDYFYWLRAHQTATVELFEKLVDLEISKSEKPREVAILDLAYSKGMKWMKFSKFIVTFDKFTWIPRFADRFKYWELGSLVLDSDEMDIVLATKSKSMAKQALDGKLAQQAHGEYLKITSWQPHGFEWHELHKINENVVLDWTLPLGETEDERRKSFQFKIRQGAEQNAGCALS